MKHRSECPRRLGGNAPCCCEADPQVAAPPSDPAAPLDAALITHGPKCEQTGAFTVHGPRCERLVQVDALAAPPSDPAAPLRDALEAIASGPDPSHHSVQLALDGLAATARVPQVSWVCPHCDRRVNPSDIRAAHYPPEEARP